MALVGGDEAKTRERKKNHGVQIIMMAQIKLGAVAQRLKKRKRLEKRNKKGLAISPSPLVSWQGQNDGKPREKGVKQGGLY